MNHSIILDELETSKVIVGCFLLRNNDILVIESERIRKGVFSKELDYEKMTQFKTTGYTISAQVYSDFLSERDYLIILKDCGILEILDSDLNRIDTLDTSLRLASGSKFLLFDNRTLRLYVNFTPTQIHAVDFQLSSGGLTFSRKDESPQCIFESVESIIDLELSWHVDYDTSRDIAVLSILLYREFTSCHYFQALKQTQFGSRKKREPWLPLIEKTHIELYELSSRCLSVATKLATFKAVPNVGFFIFSLEQIYFFEIPGGYEHTFAGKKIQKFATSKAFSEFNGQIYSKYEIELGRNVFVSQKPNLLQFKIPTSANFTLITQVQLIHEDSDELTYHWGDFSSEYHVINQLTSTPVNPQVDQIFALNNSLYLLITVDKRMLFLDMGVLEVIHSTSYPFLSILYSACTGQSFKKFITCGSTTQKRGFIECQSFGYKDFLFLEKSYTFTSEVLNMWSTKNSVWWKSSEGTLYQNGTLINRSSSATYISMNNDIIKEASIVVLTSVWKDSQHAYCFIKSSGKICWSDDVQNVPIRGFKSSSLAKYCLASLKHTDGSKITVIAIDNALTIFKNHHIVMPSFDVSSSMEAISSIFIVADDGFDSLLMGDINGKLLRLNLRTMIFEDTIKIGCGKVKICGIPESHNVLLYTQDDLYLLSYNPKAGYEYTKIHITHSMNQITARDKTQIDILNGLHLFSYSISAVAPTPEVIKTCVSSKTHFHAKFIELPCSTKYVVTSSFRLESTPDKERTAFLSEIQLHDLQLGKTVYRYDISGKYPQAIVSDIKPIPFIRTNDCNSRTDTDTSYAKRLTFSKCFIVSLNYETAEDDTDLNNLLLFSVQDGTLEFHLGVRTGFAITALHNYSHYTFLTAGEVLQAFEVNYLVKENAFRIAAQSEKVGKPGFIRSVLVYDHIPLNKIVQNNKILDDYNGKRDKLLTVDLLRGIQEFDLTFNSERMFSSTSCSYKVKISPVVNSRSVIRFIDSTNDTLLTDASVIRRKRENWVALCYADNQVSLHCIHSKGHDTFEFRLACPVSSITSLHNDSLDDYDDLTANNKMKENDGLFTLTTHQGGCYILRDSRHFKAEERLECKIDEQLQYIGAACDEGKIVDRRIFAKRHNLSDLFNDTIV